MVGLEFGLSISLFYFYDGDEKFIFANLNFEQLLNAIITVSFGGVYKLLKYNDLRQLNPNAENVSLATNVPKLCIFLGEIENLNVHRDLDIHTPLQNLKIDNIRFLKNEGAKRGANLVVSNPT